LVVIYAHDSVTPGRRYVLHQGPFRIGRQPDNELQLDDDSVSRRHARVEVRDGVWYLMDVGSSNGTLINDQELSGCVPLRNGDRVKIGKNVIKYLRGDDAETAYFEEIYQLSITDGLMQIHNRRYFDETLVREFLRASRHGRPLSVVLIDVDHFKRINDDYGHLTGDYVLHELAQVVQATVPNDTVARYGGEEIAVILAEATLDQARAVAENVRRRVETARFSFQDSVVHVTISLGCAQYRSEDTSARAMVGRADEMLFTAKDDGRNRVC
jgi:two-component system cell cycle response regulator